MFQFTHPWRCDLSDGVVQEVDIVSIHAPVKVRQPTEKVGKNLPVSIHAPVKVRPKTLNISTVLFRFQFTHPWRCDWITFISFCIIPCFNSRTREGATCIQYHHLTFLLVSIHAPVKVRPLQAQKDGYQFLVSIHAPVKVRQAIIISWTSSTWVSIHAPVKVRLFLLNELVLYQMFQFTHPWRCDNFSSGSVLHIPSFNSRTREGATWCNRK